MLHCLVNELLLFFPKALSNWNSVLPFKHWVFPKFEVADEGFLCTAARTVLSVWCHRNDCRRRVAGMVTRFATLYLVMQIPDLLASKRKHEMTRRIIQWRPRKTYANELSAESPFSKFIGRATQRQRRMYCTCTSKTTSRCGLWVIL